MTKSERNKLLIGIGVGAAAGFGTGYFVCKKVSDNRHRREMKKERRKAYLEGVEHGKDPERINEAFEDGKQQGLEEGLDEAKKFLDQYCVVPDEGDTPEMIQEKVRKKQEELNRMAAESETKTPENKENNIPAPKEKHTYTEPVKIGMATYDTMNHQVVFLGSGGTKIAYPANLFIDENGEVLDSIYIRQNIRKHEHNKARLNLIWSQMGWGAYIPDLDAYPNDEDIGNLDVLKDVDDDDDRLLGDEPEEKTREKERYFDDVNRYISNPEEAPRIISRREFDDECYLDKVYFDYYDVDNKFIENTDVDNEIGPFDYFGVTDGKVLFAMKAGLDDDDPDVVHVKNFKMNCVIEVTRYHRAYESIKDGGAYVRDGSTD